ncbi:MAG TPA: sugar phosphate isomerase/epimerase family protein [Acidobacteriaceae bacterium]|nr:sugar phosphate isomerase/epimerase family protein [Acidobacteriaceae bacterium]
MKFGINLLLWAANFEPAHLPLLERIRAAGFDGVEVPVYKGRDLAISALRKGLADTQMECTICSVLVEDLSLLSEDASIRTRAIDQLRENIAVTAEVGAQLILGPMYAPVGYLPGRRRTEDEWKRAVEAWQQLGPWLVQHNVTAAIEPLNRFETYFLNTAADAARFCDEVDHPNVGVLFDTFHANIEEADIAAGYRRLGHHLKHVHTCENNRGIPGSGHVEWREVFEALQELHYDGWLTIESFNSNLPEIAAATAIWRDLATPPESIAFEGIHFLKQMAAQFALSR